ncbi:MAG: hypothetical protein ABIR70_17020 [Bryobacteraceae bacterium]
MNDSILTSDLSTWMPWASLGVNTAYLLLGLVTLVIVGCIARMVNRETHPSTSKRKATLAH